MAYFWTNTIWFILLGITTVITVAYLLLKTDKPLLMFALYLTISGMTYIYELTIFGFLKSYEYYPMIFHQISRLDHGMAGNVFSQYSVSATALLAAVLDLRFYWYLIIASIYGAIEELFLYLGIYKHNWYQTWMTVVGLIILCSVTKLLYKKVFKGRTGPVLLYVLIYFAAFVPHTQLITWPFKLLGYPAYNETILRDPILSAMLLFAISFNVQVIIIMLAYFFKLKWWWQAMVILTFYLAYYIAYLLNYIIYKDIWILFLFATAEIFGMYLCVFIVDRMYDKAYTGR